MIWLTVPALAGALAINAGAAPAPATPPGQAHPALALSANAKLMLVKGPAHVGHIVSAGTGTAQVFEVATPNASNAGCIANPVAGTTPVTLANASTQEVKREIPAGHILCANLTAGTSMSLTWYGHESVSGASGVTITSTQPKLLGEGPFTIVHTSTGGDGQVTLYTMNSGAGTDADCVAPVPAGAKPPPPAAEGTLPTGGAILKKLALRAAEKQNLVVPAGKAVCGLLSSGGEAKVDWKTK